MHEYRKEEQPDTDFNLDERVKLYGNADITKYHDIVVEFDAQKLNPKNFILPNWKMMVKIFFLKIYLITLKN